MPRLTAALWAAPAGAALAWGLAALLLTPQPVWQRAAAFAILVACAVIPRRGPWLLRAGAAGLVLGLALRWAPSPSDARDWVQAQARSPTAEISAERVVVHAVRNFRYTPAGDVVRADWDDRSYDPRRLNSMWFGVSPFGSVPGVAHVFVSFGFDDGDFLAVSIEARRERGEDYGPVRGMFRRYEIVYVLADERDVVALRTNVWKDRVHLYPVRGDPARFRAVFADILARANRLAQAPEFYDTLANSCSSNLARHANHVVPGRVPLSPRVLLAGFSDGLALELGLIDFDGDIDAARARHLVNARAAGNVDAGDFSARLRARPPTPGG